MDIKLHEILAKSFSEDSLCSITLTPGKSCADDIVKVIIRPVTVKNKPHFQTELRRSKLVQHRNIDAGLSALEHELDVLMDQSCFSNMNIFTVSELWQISPVSGGIKAVRHKQTQSVKQPALHNKAKQYIIPEGVPVPFLVQLGVMDNTGRVLNPMRKKFVQINRFLEIVDDIYPSLPAGRTLKIIDFGCGKSYLTFGMYHYFTEIKNRTVSMVGLDLKDEVIRDCECLARSFGFDSLHFEIGNIADYSVTDRATDRATVDRSADSSIDMVVTLHACDTATDAALEKAVKDGVGVILSVPCCQHELFSQLQNETLSPLLEHGILKERFSALLTDAVRAHILTLLGYSVRLIEFVDMEHTPKNIMIKAIKQNSKPSRKIQLQRLTEYDRLLEEFSVSPYLSNVLKDIIDRTR